MSPLTRIPADTPSVADYWNLAARWETIAEATTGDLSEYARRQVTYWNNAATYGELAA